ncbi:MAG: hypothetical protein LBC41_00015 [Clostridiales bacterium]|jgi:hypothetical protein|nr:hypothetical protein [Clostridiales bacterium]MDR2749016.1 hypothetical protein [Clostridiales bacterium]
MGLVKFRKDLSFDDFLALAEKDEDTLYFINDTNRIYLGDQPYGGKDILVEDSESISLSFVDDTLEATAIISSEDDNALELKADGLYAPAATVPLVKYPEDGDLAISAGSVVDDSNISIVEEINSSSNDWMVPSVAAVYEAISKVAPTWNSDTVDDSFLPDQPKRQWLNFTNKISTTDNIFQIDRSFVASDGKTVRFVISWIINWAEVMYAPLVPFTFPKPLMPKHDLYFAYNCSASSAEAPDPLMEKGGWFCIYTSGEVIIKNQYSLQAYGQYFATATGEYEI